MNIILIKLSALGDVLVTSAAAKSVIQNPKVNKLYFVVLEGFEKAIQIKDAEVIIIPDWRRHNALFFFIKLLKILLRLFLLGNSKYFLFHRSLILRVIFFVVSRGRLYGYQTNSILVRTKEKFSKVKNRVVYEFAILSETLDGLQYDGLEFNISTQKINYICQSLVDSVEPYIVINPGGGNSFSSAKNRILPVENYVEIIKSLNCTVVLVGSGANDARICSEITDRCKRLGFKIVNYCSKLDFNSTAYLLDNARCYLGNDSSLLFLAAALDVKSICFFGPTDPQVVIPPNATVKSISASYHCSPCYDPLIGREGTMYTCARNICMEKIKPHFVQKALRELGL